MPKVVIKKSDLPAVSKNGSYIVRVRIISDDKNSASYWTPIFNMLLPSEGSKLVKDAVQASVYHNKIGQSLPQNYNIYVSWHDPNDLGFYDVYSQWHNASGWTEWIYHSTQTVRNFAFNPPLYLTTQGDASTYFDKYNVAVTRANYHHVYVPELALFNTNTAPGGGLSLV